MAAMLKTSSWGMNSQGERISLTQMVFEKYDTDGNGTITKDEFVAMIYALGRHMDAMEREAAFSFVELNGDGRITFGEFLRWWQAEDRWGLLALTPDQLGALWQVAEYYEYYDDDQSGVLSYDQFRNVYRYMKESGYGVGEKTPEDIFSEIDTDGTESINYNEFIRWMVHLGVLEADGILRRDLSIEEIAKAAALPEGGGWAGVEKEEEEAGAAVGVGSGEGAKLCWQNLVGTGGESAVGIIQAERPDLVRVSVLEDGAMMTMDYREDRVRVMVDENGNVSQPPTVG
jgi:Ca2+-binding EF-hand superfamily protein